ncbi:hypothetical protein BDR03DRAFT_1090732 [Suillus americanus]|nr:hypothetical protein BDR03DRAFT_1090732 [Suillus americanus]
MSSLLSKSFDALKISTSDSIRQRRIKIVRPKKQPHVQFYGYAISREWLVRFAEQHCPEELPDRNAKCYQTNAILRAYEHLVDLTGINNLDPVTCFNPKGGSVPPEWIAVYDGDYDDVLSDEEILAFQIQTVYVLTVCSDEEDCFEERPSQEQMDYITKLVGHEPQWWMRCRRVY